MFPLTLILSCCNVPLSLLEILNAVKNLLQVDRKLGLDCDDVEPLLRGERDLRHDQRRQVLLSATNKRAKLGSGCRTAVEHMPAEQNS